MATATFVIKSLSQKVSIAQPICFTQFLVLAREARIHNLYDKQDYASLKTYVKTKKDYATVCTLSLCTDEKPVSMWSTLLYLVLQSRSVYGKKRPASILRSALSRCSELEAVLQALALEIGDSVPTARFVVNCMNGCYCLRKETKNDLLVPYKKIFVEVLPERTARYVRNI